MTGIKKNRFETSLTAHVDRNKLIKNVIIKWIQDKES